MEGVEALQKQCADLVMLAVDDERYLNAPSQAFGEIVVSVYSVEAFIQGQKEMKQKVESDQYKMHERSKKGLAHCVR